MIRKAETKDAAAVAELALLLWPEHTLDELTEEFEELISQDDAA